MSYPGVERDAMQFWLSRVGHRPRLDQRYRERPTKPRRERVIVEGERLPLRREGHPL